MIRMKNSPTSRPRRSGDIAGVSISIATASPSFTPHDARPAKVAPAARAETGAGAEGPPDHPLRNERCSGPRSRTTAAIEAVNPAEAS